MKDLNIPILNDFQIKHDDTSKLILSLKRKTKETGILFNSVVLILSNINIGQFFV